LAGSDLTTVTFTTSGNADKEPTVGLLTKSFPDVITSKDEKISIFKQLDQVRIDQAVERIKTNSNLSLDYAKLDFSHMPPPSKSVFPIYKKTLYSRIDHLKTRALQYMRREK